MNLFQIAHDELNKLIEIDDAYTIFLRYAGESDSIDEETLFSVIRFERNMLLSRCDWTQANDSNVDKSAWATYRQQLRDLPAQNKNPRLITFPAQPE